MKKQAVRKRESRPTPAAAPVLNEEQLAVFILTHKRPDRVFTTASLKRHGWTGPVYYIVDDEDPTVDEYRKNFGEDKVIMFSKEEEEKTMDLFDNHTGNRGTITYVRNAAFHIAEKLGYRYFIQLDDDYAFFALTRDTRGRFHRKPIRNLDEVLHTLLDYYKSLPPHVLSLAMAQGGDFLGGSQGSMAKNLKMRRKAMNSFICDVKRPFKFRGRMNEDVNTYVSLQARGFVFFTTPLCHLTQHATQSNAGGITELYKAFGTYAKSMYTVMSNPSCVKVGVMGSRFPRIHHQINWRYAAPKIISPDYRKE
jgi:hypothetical protein